MSVRQLWAGLLLASLAAGTSQAQPAEPPLASPYTQAAPAVPAAPSGVPEAAPPGAPAAPAEGTAVPPGATPTRFEPPPPLNPYPTNRGMSPRRWTSEDMARVRRMLEAERARRSQTAGRARYAPRRGRAIEPELPRVYGDAGAAFGLGLSIDAVFHDDRGFRSFDQSKASSRLGMWASYDLASLSKIAILSGELGFGVEANDGAAELGMGNQLPMHLHSTSFHAALGVRWDIASFFAPHVRLSGGVSALDLEVAPSASEEVETDSALSGFGALGAGFLLHTPARLLENRRGQLASLKFGVMLEVGYALRSSVDFALNAARSSRSIPVVNADLGQLDLSGAYVRSSLVTRF